MAATIRSHGCQVFQFMKSELLMRRRVPHWGTSSFEASLAVFALSILVAGRAESAVTREQIEECTGIFNNCIADCDVKRDACFSTGKQCDKLCYGRCRAAFGTCIPDRDREGKDVPGARQPEATGQRSPR
jgi:hypothetical protein